MTIKISITFILEYLFHHPEKSKVLIVNEKYKNISTLFLFILLFSAAFQRLYLLV